MSTVNILRKLTPVLVVENIEPVIVFWQKLDVQPSVQVPAPDGGLAFAIFVAEGVELMYQTAASVREDLVASASDAAAFRAQPQQVTLYIEVNELADVERRLAGEHLVMPRRKTFYGATETAYTDPVGNIIVFAERDR